ncbi:MAG: dienelactone hydrolase, partial [bacterium]|nr:dienelactone hydrolase [bacterium]
NKMKTLKWIVLALAAFGFIRGEAQSASYNVGSKTIKYVDGSRNRPLVTQIWYPTKDERKPTTVKRKHIFKPGTAVFNGTLLINNKKMPLLIISHGTGGNRFSLSWLAEPLVNAGYIVVSLDHYGNSSDNKIPREFLKWWERALDVKYVLSQVLKEPGFKAVIDHERIGGIGFSIGGYTNIALAGGYINRDLIFELEENSKGDASTKLPPEFPSTGEEIDFRNDKQIVSSYVKYKDQVKDGRIKAFFVMAPAIGLGFNSKAQVNAITAPLLIVAGQKDTICPIKTNAVHYNKLIKSSSLFIFKGEVGHYVFLNEATEFGREVAPGICSDHPHVSRADIHEKAIKLAIEFFERI